MSLGLLDLDPLVRGTGSGRSHPDPSPLHFSGDPFMPVRLYQCCDPDPDPSLGPLDLDPLVRGTDPVDLTRPISASFSRDPYMPVR